MKIVVAADLAPDKIGSLEDQIFSFAKTCKQSGHEIALAFSGAASKIVLDHYSNAGEATYGLGPLGTQTWLHYFKNSGADRVVLHFFPANTFFLKKIRAAVSESTKIIFVDHISKGLLKRSFLKHWLLQLKTFFFRKCVDRYIAVSHFVAQRLIETDFVPPSKVVVLHHGVDTHRFVPSSNPATTPTLVCVSHLIPAKGVQVFLNALYLLKNKGIEPCAQIVGDGPMINELKAYVEKMGLSKVEFLGKRNDVHFLLAQATIAIVPSLWPEAFGLATADAMACGTPVIATNVGGLPEAITDGVTGILIEPNSPEALADAIARLLKDSAFRKILGKHARAKVESQFNLEKYVVELLRIVIY